ASYAEKRAMAELRANEKSTAAAVRAASAYYKQLDAVSALRRGLAGMGVAVNSLASEEARLKHAADSTSAALGRQNAQLRQAAAAEATLHEMRRLGAGHMLATAAAGYVGAHGVAHGIRETLTAGGHYQHERVALANAGRSPAEIEEIERASLATT